MFEQYVLPAIIIAGLLLAVYLLSRMSEDANIDVRGSDMYDDVSAPIPPRPYDPEPKLCSCDQSDQKSKTKGDDISNLSKSQLIKLAQNKGIKVNSRMRKEQIVKKLK